MMAGIVCLIAFAAQASQAQPAKTPAATKGPAPKAQAAPKSVDAQSASTIHYGVNGDETVIEIKNVTYEFSWEGVPGRPANERLLLRKTETEKQVIGDMGEDAKVTLEAWPLGTDPKQKPLYTINVDGSDGRTEDGAIFVVLRGLEDTPWWSVYKLGTGQHLLDTYTPLVKFSLSQEIEELRFLGFEAPPDDTPDARLKEPHVAGVLTFASKERVVREFLITCDDPKQAAMWREYEDETRTLSVSQTPAPAVAGKRPGEPARAVHLVFTEDWPSQPNPAEIVIPVLGRDLDLAHAKLPAHTHIAAWQR